MRRRNLTKSISSWRGGGALLHGNKTSNYHVAIIIVAACRHAHFTSFNAGAARLLKPALCDKQIIANHSVYVVNESVHAGG